LLFSPVISEHFSKNRMIISVVAAKIWYLQKCTVFIGPPCTGPKVSGHLAPFLYSSREPSELSQWLCHD